jgi:hypothetical protein
MDAKNIFIAIQHAAMKAQWIKSGESEWIYIGEKGNFDREQAQKEIDEFFSEKVLYMSVDRHIGHEVTKDKAAWNIQKHLENGVFLANQRFKKVMVFSNIGTFRRGCAAS